jgi:PAS domain-containing protein
VPPPDTSRQLDHIISRLANLQTSAFARRPCERTATTALIRHAVCALALPTFVSNDQGRYVAVSESACTLTNYSFAELIRHYVWDLTSDATLVEFEPLWRAFLSVGRQRGRYALQSRTGCVIDVEYTAQAHVVRGYHVSVLMPVGAAS